MKKMMKKFRNIAMSVLTLSVLFTGCKKELPKEDAPITNSGERKYVLMINNGAQSLLMNETITYTAALIDASANVIPASNIAWTSSDPGVAGINASGIATPIGTGYSIIRAKVTVEGADYICEVPVNVWNPTVFVVGPSAIMGFKNETFQLETVYLAPGAAPTYTFVSENNAIASVSPSGLVTLTGLGLCSITVTASTLPTSPMVVPVSVIGAPEIPLLVTKVIVTPNSAEKFRNETQQFTATAYKSDGSVANETIIWNSTDLSVATVNASGMVTTVGAGDAYIQATAKGISGQSQIIVSPDTIVVVEPFWADVAAGGTKQFTAKAYNARTGMSLITTMTNFVWNIPTYGSSAFDIATVSNTGLVTVKSDALPGFQTFVTATFAGNQDLGGGAAVTVSLCDCGAGSPDVNSISASNQTISLMSGIGQLSATALDIYGDVVSNPGLVFCSDSPSILNIVNPDGSVVMPGSPGIATITICSGSYATKTIQVTVTQ